MVRAALAVLAVALLASACDTGFKFSTSPSDQKGPVPTTPAASGSTSTTSGAPLCVSQDLRATSGSRTNPNDVGGAVGDVVIYNSTATTCQLRGAPALHLLRTSGSPIGVQNADSVSPSVAPVVLQPKGKSTGELVFTWQNWCRANPGALEMQMELAGGKGTLIAPFESRLGTYVPACVMPDKPSVLRVQYAYVAGGASKLQA